MGGDLARRSSSSARATSLIIGGAIGYWAFDNAVLWATFEAFGDAPALSVILLGYLIGQLGGLLPIPGGIGGIDGGLIGALVVFGAPLADDRSGGPRLPGDPLLAAAAHRRPGAGRRSAIQFCRTWTTIGSMPWKAGPSR